MAAVALLCLGLGFSLGRFLPRAAAADLSRPEVPGPRRPGPIEAPKGALSAEKETEELSTLAFALLRFPASQRDEAGRAAEYLRAHGVESARIRLLVTEKTKRELWVVLAYTPSREAAESVLAELRKVPASSIWPELKRTIDELPPTKLLPL
jgi:hypothetical protein